MKTKSTFGFLANQRQLAKKIVLAASFIFFANAQAQTVDATNCGTVTVWTGTTPYPMTYYAPFSSATKCGYAMNQGGTNAPSLIYDNASSKWLVRYSINQITGWSSTVNTGILAPNTTVGNWTKVFASITDLTGTLGSSVVTLGTTELAKTNNQTYPNPTTGIVNLKNSQNIGQVQVYSLEGKLLKTQTANNKEAQIDITNLPKGVYMLKTNQGSSKIIKE